MGDKLLLGYPYSKDPLLLRTLLHRLCWPDFAGSAATSGLDCLFAGTVDPLTLLPPPLPYPPLVVLFDQAIVDNPELFESVGITGGSGSSLSDPCLLYDFVLDINSEVMGTQVSRGPYFVAVDLFRGSKEKQNCPEYTRQAAVNERLSVDPSVHSRHVLR